MAHVSTFELLLKPQLPRFVTNDPNNVELKEITRTILQGYFLSIANLSDSMTMISLEFTTTTPSLQKEDILTFLDTKGGGEETIKHDIMNVGSVNKFQCTFGLDAYDTGLFILQPNILDDEIFKEADYELRGYVDIKVLVSAELSTKKKTELLLTPEHRGTFFGNDRTELGEVAYALPLANGKALYEL